MGSLVGRWAVWWVDGQFGGYMGSLVGLQAILWVFSWTVNCNPRVAFARGVDLGAVVAFAMAWWADSCHV